MRYLIDGYNLIFSLDEEESSLQESRELIINKLKKLSTVLSATFTVVFDAAHDDSEWNRSHTGDLEIIFTERGETADECIIDEVRRAKTPAAITVVTSDKGLSLEAKTLGAQTKKSCAFLSWSSRKFSTYQPDEVEEKPPFKSSYEFDRWLYIFENKNH